MRTIYIRILMLGLLAITNSAFAARFVCPNTYQTVMTGFTSAQVASACGVPTTITTNNVASNAPVVQEQWVYSLRNPLSQGVNQYFPELILTFQDDKVVQISSNNQSALSLFLCYRTNRIRIGSTSAEVRQNCGLPSSTNSIQTANSQEVALTEWVYNFGPYRPQMIFTFQNGVLQNIRMGQIVK
jgi:hypothetical protein